MKYVGLDIGGANLKAAVHDGAGHQISFPVWRSPNQLGDQLANLVESLSPGECRLGVTMTAELADCFESRASGVRSIVQTVEQRFGDSAPRYYQTDGGMVAGEQAIADWSLTASANWHASARYAFEFLGRDSGWLVDVGSTTTDLIPVMDGEPCLDRLTDLDRLENGQLVYAGVGRTPLCALLNEVAIGDRTIGMAREVFATMSDAWRWLQRVGEDPHDRATADGRPATRACSGARLARMLGGDLDTVDPLWLDAVAEQSVGACERHVTRALERLMDAYREEVPAVVVLVGSGCRLLQSTIERTVLNRYGTIERSYVLDSPDEAQLTPARAMAAFRARADTESSCDG